MNYSAVVSKAWQYVWKYKILWLFALFAGSLIGGATGTSSWTMSNSRANNHGNFWTRLPGSHPWANGIENWFRAIPEATWIWLGLVAFSVAVFISLLSLFVGTAGRAGLIKGLLMAEDRPEGKSLSFNEVWQGMKPYYWRLLLLRLFIGLAGFVLGITLILIALFLTVISLGTILLLLIPLALLIIPINWFIKSLIIHATIALVDEDLDIFTAIKRGWEVVSKHVGSILVVMLIVVLINFALAIGSLIPLGIASLPWIIILASGGSISTVGWLAGGILVGLAVLFVCLIGMWVNTLVHGIFVVSFRRFNTKPNPAFPANFVPATPTTTELASNSEPAEGNQNIPSA
jgi:hypothetical protein